MIIKINGYLYSQENDCVALEYNLRLNYDRIINFFADLIKANRIFENYICYILYGIFHFLFPTEKKSIHLNFFQLCFNFKVDGHYFAPLLFSFDFVLFRLCTSHSWVFLGGRGAGSLFCFTLLYFVFLANCLWVIKLLLIHINIVIYIYIFASFYDREQ